MEMDSEQCFVRVNSSCVRLNSTMGWGGGIYFFNLDDFEKLYLVLAFFSVNVYNIITNWGMRLRMHT